MLLIWPVPRVKFYPSILLCEMKIKEKAWGYKIFSTWPANFLSKRNEKVKCRNLTHGFEASQQNTWSKCTKESQAVHSKNKLELFSAESAFFLMQKKTKKDKVPCTQNPEDNESIVIVLWEKKTVLCTSLMNIRKQQHKKHRLNYKDHSPMCNSHPQKTKEANKSKRKRGTSSSMLNENIKSIICI